MEIRLENLFVDIWLERVEVRNPVESAADIKLWIVKAGAMGVVIDGGFWAVVEVVEWRHNSSGD